VNGFAAKNDDHACETGQCDRNLRSNTKSFARFHYQRVIPTLAGTTYKSPIFLRSLRFALPFRPTPTKGVTQYG
jgi:hypothetical protein